MVLRGLSRRGISLFQRICNWINILLFGAKGTIYVFHEVDLKNTSNTIDSCFCTVDNFESFVKSNLHRFVSLESFIGGDAKDSIVISFDDVPESVYKNAYPILNREKIPFTLYISTRFIDEPGFLSTEQIKELSLNPLCTIGAHTMNHVRLISEKDSFLDMKGAKDKIEAIIGKSVDHLAYPFGRADAVSWKVRREAKDAGFVSAVCTIPTKVPRLFNNWYIPRMVL